MHNSITLPKLWHHQNTNNKTFPYRTLIAQSTFPQTLSIQNPKNISLSHHSNLTRKYCGDSQLPDLNHLIVFKMKQHMALTLYSITR